MFERDELEGGKGGGEEEGGEGVKGGGGRGRRKQKEKIGGGLQRGVQMTENCRTFRIQKENVQCINHVKVDN